MASRPTNKLSNPFPQGSCRRSTIAIRWPTSGRQVAAPTREYQNPYAQTWSFGVQRELPGKLVLDVHYWGNKGTRLLTTWNINQLPNQYLALGSG